MPPRCSTACPLDTLPPPLCNPLNAVFAPRRVVVIGAEATPGSPGWALLENLRGFRPAVQPIHPDPAEVLGLREFPAVGTVPEGVDLALIVSPAPTVLGIVRECVQAGVRAGIILSPGFEESGDQAAALGRGILAEARRGPMRLVGPNGLGIVAPHAGLNATCRSGRLRPGHVALVSQSRPRGLSSLEWAEGRGIGLSAFVSAGDMLDVGWSDLLYYLSDDPHTRCIACCIESLGDARSFLSAAREVALSKPILIFQAPASQAARGWSAEEDSVLEAVWRRAGVLCAGSCEEMLEMAEVLARREAGPTTGPGATRSPAEARAEDFIRRYRSHLRGLYEIPAPRMEPEAGEEGRGRAAGIIGAARAVGRTILTPREAGDLLAAYGIETAQVDGEPGVKGAAYRLAVGSRLDPGYGPVLWFGAGEASSETGADRALALPPLNATLARRWVERTRVFAALAGVREPKPVDLAVLDEGLVRFSQLVCEQRWIKEMEINPLLVWAEGLAAGGAHVVLHEAGVTEDRLPRLAIRPYPTRYVRRWRLKNGTAVTIRPIRPEDEPLLAAFHGTLSERSVYQRYFMPLRLEQRVVHERLSRLCFIDYDREMALVAEHRADPSGRAEILGVGRLSKLHCANQAEFAILVGDRWQRQGLGRELLRLLVQFGREEGLARITGSILPGNHGMLAVCRALGFAVGVEGGTGEYRAELVLST